MFMSGGSGFLGSSRFGRLVNGRSFGLPGVRKLHPGLNFGRQVTKNLWVRVSLFQEIVGSKLRFTGIPAMRN